MTPSLSRSFNEQCSFGPGTQRVSDLYVLVVAVRSVWRDGSVHVGLFGGRLAQKSFGSPAVVCIMELLVVNFRNPYCAILLYDYSLRGLITSI